MTSNESQEVSARVEGFLRSIEAKDQSAVHKRILQACRSADPSTAMDAELTRIIQEIVDEN